MLILLHINIVTANDVWMDLTFLICKISIHKKKHGKSESINYTLLNEKRIHDDEKKKFACAGVPHFL